jgi:hypothetical protein
MVCTVWQLPAGVAVYSLPLLLYLVNTILQIAFSSGKKLDLKYRKGYNGQNQEV